MICEIFDLQKIKCFRDIITNLCNIGNDIIMEVKRDYLSFRTINDLRTALPIIRINSVFFDNYEYKGSEMIFEITSKWLKMALKYVTHMVNIKMEMIPDSFHFNLKILDCNEIEHICLLNIQNTDLPNALFDYSKVNVSLVCRTNVFYDVKKAFKCCNNVYLELNRINKMKCLIISSIESDKDLRSCKLLIQRNDECDPIFLNDSSIVKLSFSALEFKQCLSLCSLISQKISIYVIEPGYPIMIKASLDKLISFEMTLSTGLENLC